MYEKYLKDEKGIGVDQQPQAKNSETQTAWTGRNEFYKKK